MMTEPDHDLDRAKALETLARRRYERHAPKAAPDWEELADMQRYLLMEHVNELVNEVLEVLTPAAPDLDAMRFKFDILADEMEGQHGRGYFEPAQVANAIRQVLHDTGDYGAPKVVEL